MEGTPPPRRAELAGVRSPTLALRRTCIRVVAPAAALVAVALVGGAFVGLSPPALLRDPLADVDLPAVTGALSWLGVLTLACTAALCAGAAFLYSVVHPGGEAGRFLAATAAVTAVLCLDDVFQLHEKLLPHFGVPEPVVYAAYAVAGLAYLVRWHEYLLHRTKVAVLSLSAALLGWSVVADFLATEVTVASTMVEDVPKLLGIAVWAAHHARTAGSAVVPLLHAAMAPVVTGSGPMLPMDGGVPLEPAMTGPAHPPRRARRRSAAPAAVGGSNATSG